MKYFNPLLIGVLLLFCSLGLWGCTHQKTGAISAKIHDLETRYAKLEEDYHVLQVTHEQNRKRLNQAETQRTALEKQKTDLAKQLESAETEREDLRKQIATERDDMQKQIAQRTTERDAAQTNLMQFSKDLQALAGRVESALNLPASDAKVTAVPASRRSD